MTSFCERHYLLLMAAIGAFVFFYGLDAYPLLNNNEGLYAAIGRDMLWYDHWVIPHLNGGLYIEKPPLLYWLLAASFQLFDVTTHAARLVPALSGFLMVLGTALFVTRHPEKKQLMLAPFLMLSSPVFVVIVRMVFFDGWLACCITIALFAFYNARMTLFYAALALAVLAKGLIALMLVCPVVLTCQYVWGAPLRRLFPWRGLALFAAIALPWHILATLRLDTFFWFYVINEHVLRFLDLRVPRDYYRGPWHYYIPRIFLAFFPSSLWMIFAVGKLRTPAFLQDKTLTFCIVWIGWFFLFFTLSRAKANYYLITIIPPLSLLASRLVATVQKDVWFGGLVAILVATEIGLLCFLPQLVKLEPHYVLALGIFTTPQALLFFACIVAGLGASWLRAQCRYHVVVLGLLQVGLIPLLCHGAGRIPEYLSSEALVPLITKEKPLYSYQDFEIFSSLAFYYPKPLVMVDSMSSDLWFASQQSNDLGLFLSLDHFKAIAKEGPIQIVVRTKKLKTFMDAMGPDARVTIIKQLDQVTLLACQLYGP